MTTKAAAPAKERAPRKSKDELFLDRGQTATLKVIASLRGLRELARKGGFNSAQVEAIFARIEQEQVDTEKAFKAALAGGKADEGDFSLATVAAKEEEKAEPATA